MLDKIIPFLNISLQELTYIQQSFGLTELKSDGTRSLPQEYLSKGQFNTDVTNFDNYKGLTYWRLRAETNQTQDNDSLVACETMFNRTYPLRLVVIVPKNLTSKDDSYTSDRIASDIVKKLADSNSAIKTTLKARMVDIETKNWNIDSKSVLKTENFEINEIKYDLSILAMDVDFTIQISPDCEIFSCPTVTDFVCSLLASTSAAKIKQCLDDNGQTSKVCGTPSANLIYAFPPTQAFGSFRTGDEYDIWSTVFVGNMNSFGTLMRPTADRSVLDGNNEFGHTFRFTGNTGGYYDHFTSTFKDVNGLVTTRSLAFLNDYLIDHFTGLGWSLIKQGVFTSQSTAIDFMLTLTVSGFSDWFLPSLNQQVSIQQSNSIAQAVGQKQSMAWRPFDDSNTTNPDGYWWTSTRRADLTINGMIGWFGGVDSRNTSDNWNGWPCRKHFS